MAINVFQTPKNLFLHQFFFSIKEGAVNGFRMGVCVPSSCIKDEIALGLNLALNPSDR